MAEIIISPKKKRLFDLPHYICINDQVLGVMKGEPVHIQMPVGMYKITVRSAFKFIESSVMVDVEEGNVSTVAFSDREKIWNIIFNIDIVFWVVKRFINVGAPWDTIYEIISNGFFAVWLMRVWVIRKHYFKIDVILQSNTQFSQNRL
jgi:hypothetical protein